MFPGVLRANIQIQLHKYIVGQVKFADRLMLYIWKYDMTYDTFQTKTEH